MILKKFILENGAIFEVKYEVVKVDNYFGVKISQGKEEQTELVSEEKSIAEEVLKICSDNGAFISALGDVVDEYITLNF